MNSRLLRAYQLLVTNNDKRVYYRAIRRLFRLKPVLSYLEVHLTDHCNLNCRGCSHFCPLADKIFADIEQYDRDVKQLSQLMANIKVIRLLGGEPLLHPDVSKFFEVTRTWFPKAKIYLVTNGILLSSMQESFWESCRRHSISIDVSIYPPLSSKESDFVQLAKSEGITLNAVKSSTFYIPINSRGDTEPEEGFRRCRKLFYCPTMVQGKVYLCAKAAYVHYFNKAFGTSIPNTGSVDLYDLNMTGWKVLSLIEKASEICRYCTFGWKKVPIQMWSKCHYNQDEWDVAS